MASVPITMLLYNGPLLCGFNVPIKGLNLSNPENKWMNEWMNEVRGFGGQAVPHTNNSNAEKIASIRAETSLFV